MFTVRITSTPISEIVQIFTVGTKIPKIFYNLIIPCQSSANNLQHRQKRKREKMQNVYHGNDIYTDSRKSPKFSQLTLKFQRYRTIYRACHRQTVSNIPKKKKKKKAGNTGHKIRPLPNYRNLYVKPGLEIDTTQPEAPIQSQMGIGE